MSLREADGYEPLDALREKAAPGAQAVAERLVRMASIVAHTAMGERDKADAAVKALMEGVTTPLS